MSKSKLSRTLLASPRRTLALTALVAVLALAAVDPAAACNTDASAPWCDPSM